MQLAVINSPSCILLTAKCALLRQNLIWFTASPNFPAWLHFRPLLYFPCLWEMCSLHKQHVATKRMSYNLFTTTSVTLNCLSSGTSSLSVLNFTAHQSLLEKKIHMSSFSLEKRKEIANSVKTNLKVLALGKIPVQPRLSGCESGLPIVGGVAPVHSQSQVWLCPIFQMMRRSAIRNHLSSNGPLKNNHESLHCRVGVGGVNPSRNSMTEQARKPRSYASRSSAQRLT